MARWSEAEWKGPVPHRTVGGMGRVHGLVAHVMEGSLTGTDSWFRNPMSRVSAHFGISKDGTAWQWADTADRAWHASGANAEWIGVEFEGHAGDDLTEAQVLTASRLLRWAHTEHGVPMQVTDYTSGFGVAYHGLGGTSWGSHPNCPGAPIIAARSRIVAAATGASPPEPDMGEVRLTLQRVIETLQAILMRLRA